MADFTDQEIDVLLIRDTYGIHKIRHRRTAAKWHKMIQYRGVCRCCNADPVVVSVVKERRCQKRLCIDCYLTALDLYHDQVLDLEATTRYPSG